MRHSRRLPRLRSSIMWFAVGCGVCYCIGFPLACTTKPLARRSASSVLSMGIGTRATGCGERRPVETLQLTTRAQRRRGAARPLMMGYEELPPATVFIPRATRVTLRNTGTEPLAIAFFFSQPGYEEYLRDTSTPEGQAAPPLSAPELAAIRERHKAHIVFDR